MPNGSLLNSNSEGRHVEESSEILQSDDNILLNASAVEEIANDDNEGSLHQEDNATSGQTRALSASVINLPHTINVPTYQVMLGPWDLSLVSSQSSLRMKLLLVGTRLLPGEPSDVCRLILITQTWFVECAGAQEQINDRIV
jgi:hypothetical protein